MASSTAAASNIRIKFEILFEGSPQCWKGARLSAIDLIGPKSAISAQSVEKGDATLKSGRLRWYVFNRNEGQSFQQNLSQGMSSEGRPKITDQIALTPQIARTIQLSARVFEIEGGHSHATKVLEGGYEE